jgi:hypothetical protein
MSDGLDWYGYPLGWIGSGSTLDSIHWIGLTIGFLSTLIHPPTSGENFEWITHG